MADGGLDQLKGFGAICFGAVGWPTAPDHISLWGLRLKICQSFDQWANVRPVRFLPGITSPLRKADDNELDGVVVRENSEGEYAGLSGRNLSGRGPGGGCRAVRPVHRSAGSASCVSPSIPRVPAPAARSLRHQEQRPAVRHGAVGRRPQARRRRLPDVESGRAAGTGPPRRTSPTPGPTPPEG
ncbi:hypothetical protein GCM10017589_61140 [Streptomyces poonensis]|nr:hypothetical protein GCM10017589_61140 [Streptomyces poonensis]